MSKITKISGVLVILVAVIAGIGVNIKSDVRATTVYPTPTVNVLTSKPVAIVASQGSAWDFGSSKDDRVKDEEDLLVTTVQIMEICGSKLSPARGALISHQLVRNLIDRKNATQAQREAFVSMVCIESRFDPNARSSAGAVGLAQIMPSLAQSFSDMCKIGQLGPDDLQDVEVNIQVGSCLFFALLRHFDGNVALTLAAYNSGAFSKTTKAIANLGTGLDETSGYLARYYSLQEKLRVAAKAYGAIVASDDDPIQPKKKNKIK